MKAGSILLSSFALGEKTNGEATLSERWASARNQKNGEAVFVELCA